MFANFRNWLDARTNYRKLMAALLLEHIPGGAKWRYVWGSTLSFVFFIQLVTGVLLMTAYSPGDTSAWSSVYFIQYEMDFGWFIRGLHHFGSQTMVVLLALHMLQVVIAGAHLPPREVNWWLGLLLMGVVLGLSLTGYLLPWDQKGFWATRVATNIAGTLPVLGPDIAKFAVGGPEYGNATLTRFFTLHVAILPPLLIVLVIAHIAVFRRHGITTVEPVDHPKQGVFWPDQVFKDLVACLVVFGIMISLVVFGGHGNKIEVATAASAESPGLYEDWAKGGRKGLGANLDAPADPGTQGYPARPEWYFLFLFQLLKYFEGDNMIIGTVVIPQGAGVLLFLLPLLGFGAMRKFGHVFGVVVVAALITGVGMLTCLALADDTLDPVARELVTLLALMVVPATGGVFLLYQAVLALLSRGVFRGIVYGLGVLLLAVLLGGTGYLIYAVQEENLPEPVQQFVKEELKKKIDHQTEDQAKARQKKQDEIEVFHKSVKEANQAAERAVQLASSGVPVDGPLVLMRNDPMTEGRKLFGINCASCHSYTNPKTGKPEFKTPESGFTASDLGYFGSKKWIEGLLDHPDQDEYFGRAHRVALEQNKKNEVLRADIQKKNKLIEEENEKIEDKTKKKKLLPEPTDMAELSGMIGWKAKVLKNRAKLEAQLKDPDLADKKKKDIREKLDEEAADFELVIAWLAKSPTAPAPTNEEDESTFAKGYFAFERRCASCHDYGGSKTAPDLKGYGSEEWLRLMVMSPGHKLRHGKNNNMPAFLNLEGAGAEVSRLWFRETNQDPNVRTIPLTDIQRELILRFMRQEDHVIFGGRPIAGLPKKQ